MKTLKRKKPPQLSPEKADLLQALSREQFFSPIHGCVIEIEGTAVIAARKVIDVILSDVAVADLWAELVHAQEKMAVKPELARIGLTLHQQPPVGDGRRHGSA